MKTIIDPVPDDLLPTVNQQESSLTLDAPESQESISGGGDVRCAQATDSKLESSKPVTGSFRSPRQAGFHCCVHILPPDYSKVPP